MTKSIKPFSNDKELVEELNNFRDRLGVSKSKHKGCLSLVIDGYLKGFNLLKNKQ